MTQRLAPPTFRYDQAEQDKDVQRRIRAFLYSRQMPSLRGLDVEVHDGAAHVSGRVGSWYEKQMATSCCQRVAGVLRVVNDVHVATAK